MPRLIIQSDDDPPEILVNVKIQKIDPAKAAVVVLGALANAEQPKKTRSDRGKRREPKLNLPPAAKVEPPPDPVLT